MNDTLIYEVSSKKKTKLITNTELYWRESLVGNDIMQAFNWMGLTFAEQGVTAFVSVLRQLAAVHMHHAPWTQEGQFSNSEMKTYALS